MKKTIICAVALAGLTTAMSSFGQGVIFADNGNAAYDVSISGAPNTTQDINLELMYGTSANAVNSSIVTLLLNTSATSSSGALGQVLTGIGDISDFAEINDPSGNEYLFSSTPGATLYLQVLGWTGNYSSYSAAVASGLSTVFAGQSSVFSVVLAATSTGQANDISNFGVLGLNSVAPTPEPATIALAGMGIAGLLALRRKK